MGSDSHLVVYTVLGRIGLVDAGGHNLLSSSRGSLDRLSSVGIDGPKISVSRIPVRIPRLANERARFAIHR